MLELSCNTPDSPIPPDDCTPVRSITDCRAIEGDAAVGILVSLRSRYSWCSLFSPRVKTKNGLAKICQVSIVVRTEQLERKFTSVKGKRGHRKEESPDTHLVTCQSWIAIFSRFPLMDSVMVQQRRINLKGERTLISKPIIFKKGYNDSKDTSHQERECGTVRRNWIAAKGK